MSIDEARQHKAMALLEHEEAKQACDALRARAETQHGRIAAVLAFARAVPRQNESYIREASALRPKMEIGARGYREAMDFDALMTLDDEIVAAEQRLAAAAKVKKEFGM